MNELKESGYAFALEASFKQIDRLQETNEELLEALQHYTQVMERFLETMPDEFVIDLIAAAVVQGAHKQAKEAINKATNLQTAAI